MMEKNADPRYRAWNCVS